MSDIESGRPSITSAIKGMFSFFTMLPINIDKKNMDDMNKCFWLTPLIGAFYGIIAVVVFCLTAEYISTFVAAVLTIFIISVMNRFLHLDGTIDVGDGLTVAGAREDHLRALKDTLIGAGGMVTGVMVILLTVSEFIAIDYWMFLFLGFTAELLARNAQVAVAAWGTPGNGMAGDSVRYCNTMSLVKSSILSAVLLVLFYLLFRYLSLNVLYWPVLDEYLWCIIAAFITSIIWGFIMSRVAEKNFGMVNGDVLGATNETSRAVMLFVMLVVLNIALRM